MGSLRWHGQPPLRLPCALPAILWPRRQPRPRGPATRVLMRDSMSPKDRGKDACPPSAHRITRQPSCEPVQNGLVQDGGVVFLLLPPSREDEAELQTGAIRTGQLTAGESGA